MAFAPDEIATKRFIVRARGYDRNEVESFLRAVAEDYRSALLSRPGDPAAVEARTAAVLERALARLEQLDAGPTRPRAQRRRRRPSRR